MIMKAKTLIPLVIGLGVGFFAIKVGIDMIQQAKGEQEARTGILVSSRAIDVAVDIRYGSPTYGQWVSATLSDQNHLMLYVPEGFAHGFCVLSAEADVVYKVTSEYAPQLERGIRWDDPKLQIPWPIRTPNLTPKDASWPHLEDADHNFVYPGDGPR